MRSLWITFMSGILVKTPNKDYPCMRDGLKTFARLQRRRYSCASQQSFVVCVEGNIASGKTHFLDCFKNNSSIKVLGEPVPQWRNVRGHNLLALLYENPKQWSFTLQTYVQLTMLQLHSDATNYPVKLMERSIHSARYVFVENLYRSGMMSDVDYVILDEWYRWIVDNHPCRVDQIVYLRTRPETVLERIHQRGRKEELTVPLSYLESLHNCHEDWLIRRTHKSWNMPLTDNVMVVDADRDLETMTNIYHQHSSTFTNCVS